VNCTRVPRAPSHTEIGNSPRPRPWKLNSAKLKQTVGRGGVCWPREAVPGEWFIAFAFVLSLISLSTARGFIQYAIPTRSISQVQSDLQLLLSASGARLRNIEEHGEVMTSAPGQHKEMP